ncbi:Cupredoxin [Vreelandella gomseomensis]|uniref:Cupredoxin n=1 Tax=Vreelandella gomseomensis TaxID=370766 RepID=A0ABU1G9B6_9GAMM|nr:Cupredoxin [Halomonas gomseomensis]MDR5874087.1 Cupredoxin [Halomonas gomseomensis]
MAYLKGVYRTLAGIAMLMALFSVSPPGLADDARISVTDADGQPLANAVVEVYFPHDASADTGVEQIAQRDAAFHPEVLAIPVMSQVAFPNEDITRHHVYSFSPAKTFNLNLYLQETPPPVRFDKPGVVVLGCNIHDHMQAFVVVSEAPFHTLTDSTGQVTLPTLPPGEHRVRVWHQRLDDSQQRWWEGHITPADHLTVPLELNATPQPRPQPSPLQQRFNEAA